MGAQLPFPFLPSLPTFLSPSFPSLLYSPSSATAKGSGEQCKLPSGSRWSLADKRHLVHFGLKSASGESNYSAVHKIIASAHKTDHFYGENNKTEANFFGCLRFMKFFT